MDGKRVTTSAVPDMSVAEVRQVLASMRRQWVDALADPEREPPYLGTALEQRSVSYERFSFLFVLGHHEKRLNKARNASSTSLDGGSAATPESPGSEGLAAPCAAV